MFKFTVTITEKTDLISDCAAQLTGDNELGVGNSVEGKIIPNMNQVREVETSVFTEVQCVCAV